MTDPGNTSAFPNTNNGMLPSEDGVLRMENYMPGDGTAMTADGVTTRMRFVLSDGVTPNQVTIGNQTASEWVLTPHPTLPGQFRWVPAE